MFPVVVQERSSEISFVDYLWNFFVGENSFLRKYYNVVFSNSRKSFLVEKWARYESNYFFLAAKEV